MHARRGCLLLLLVIVWLFAPIELVAQPAEPYVGRSVRSIVDELRAAGVPLVYSTNLLPDSLRVESEPTATEPLALVRELLRPHGLALRAEGGAWLVVRAASAAPTAELALTVVADAGGAVVPGAAVEVDGERRATASDGTATFAGLRPGRHTLTVSAPGFLSLRRTIDLASGAARTQTVALVTAVQKLDEVTVTASRYDVRQDVQPSASSFSRDEIETLAELGDDTARVAHRLPGIASDEFSARSHVRGGAVDELTVMLDGLRLVEPFHLRDYEAVFSAIDPRIVAGTEIYSGGFPAAYGDSLSGLMLVEPRAPTGLAHEVSMSLLYTGLLSSGTFAGGRGSWLASMRRSNLGDLVSDEIGDPAYHDSFVRVGIDVGSRHRLTFNRTGLDDDVVLFPSNSADDREAARSEVDGEQTWLVLDSEWTPALSSRTWAYAADFRSLRTEDVADVDEIVGRVRDGRTLQTTGVKQTWRYQPAERHLLAAGFEAERLDARFDYASETQWFGLLATLDGAAPPAPQALAVDAEGESAGAFVSDRIRLGERWVAELGLRWDRQRYTPGDDEEQLSPRVSALYRLGSRTDLRLSYGRYSQSRRAMDLQVGDGETELGRVQRAAHSIVSIEHRFDAGVSLRVEAFRKGTKSPRPRYENLFDPLVLLAELRPGRVRVAPERAEARGVEILVEGGAEIPWWVGYSVSRVEDVIDGERVPRGWDQRFALDAGVTWRLAQWNLGAALSSHSGWPATDLTVEPVGGQVIAVAGRRNELRLRGLQRIDLRASRAFAMHRGSLDFFVEITNLTNRRNPCCLAYDEGRLVDGTPTLLKSEQSGLPRTGNVGLRWEF
jgi:TonB dependent receptor-like, beta-barrel/Carboxypeptidase regulatory-like domain/TonB-dependent Receptor Plug Domain